MRARRLASAVVVASLTVGGLSACRSQPTVAAYYGDSGQVSEQQVQEIWDEAHDALSAQPRAEGNAPVQMPFSRADVVHALVLRQILQQMAQQHRVTLPAGLPFEEAAAEQNLPADSEYVRLRVENGVLRNLLTEQMSTQNAQPSETDLRTVYDVLAANGGVPPGTDFAAWNAQVTPQNKQLVAGAATMRDEMQEVAEDLRVDVNPRYQPFELNLLSAGGGQQTLDLIDARFGADQQVPVADVN
ncbi:hypothetical protein AB0F81_31955 [Actinoplanes sp. NPDC024001]|uniref:hypothetical protein n=1 Tax=Actinoplanes sp. NPDC024001 TaxID=3154598 RepID=UPI003401D9B1